MSRGHCLPHHWRELKLRVHPLQRRQRVARGLERVCCHLRRGVLLLVRRGVRGVSRWHRVCHGRRPVHRLVRAVRAGVHRSCGRVGMLPVRLRLLCAIEQHGHIVQRVSCGVYDDNAYRGCVLAMPCWIVESHSRCGLLYCVSGGKELERDRGDVAKRVHRVPSGVTLQWALQLRWQRILFCELHPVRPWLLVLLERVHLLGMPSGTLHKRHWRHLCFELHTLPNLHLFVYTGCRLGCGVHPADVPAWNVLHRRCNVAHGLRKLPARQLFAYLQRRE